MYIVLEKVISIIGIIFCALGAWFISRGLIKKTDMDLMNENCFTYGYNINYVVSGIRQKIEGNCGIILIIIGSSLQIYSIISNEKTPIMHKNCIILSIACTAIVCSFLIIFICYLSNIFINKAYRNKVKEHVNKHQKISENANNKVINNRIRLLDSKHKDITDNKVAFQKFQKFYND